MISTGLDSTDLRKFNAALRHDYLATTRIQLLDKDQKVLGEIDGDPQSREGVLSGQVDMDESADVSRSFTLQVYDPGNKLGLTGNGPTDPILYNKYMMRIFYCAKMPGMARVDVPIFTGPITKADGASGVIDITGQGKESLLTKPSSMSTSYKRGWAKTSIISNLLEKNGEDFRQITRWSSKTTSDILVASTDAPWPVLRKLARSLTSSSTTYPWLGYDGRGTCVLKSWSKTEKWVFDDTWITEEPKPVFDIDRMRNLVVGIGNDTGSGKTPIRVQARAPKTDPFSPENLGRSGVPFFVREEIQGDWTSKAQAQRAVNEALDDYLKAGVDVEMSTFVVPHLEQRDTIRVNWKTWSWPMQVSAWTIPLGSTQSMTHSRHSQVPPKMRIGAKGRVKR